MKRFFTPIAIKLSFVAIGHGEFVIGVAYMVGMVGGALYRASTPSSQSKGAGAA